MNESACCMLGRWLPGDHVDYSGGITLDSLRDACDENEVPYWFANGKLVFGEGGIGDLLDVLNRRLYTDGLVPGSVTWYKAGSRHIRA